MISALLVKEDFVLMTAGNQVLLTRCLLYGRKEAASLKWRQSRELA
jgi:hypothetical protein